MLDGTIIIPISTLRDHVDSGAVQPFHVRVYVNSLYKNGLLKEGHPGYLPHMDPAGPSMPCRAKLKTDELLLYIENAYAHEVGSSPEVSPAASETPSESAPEPEKTKATRKSRKPVEEPAEDNEEVEAPAPAAPMLNKAERKAAGDAVRDALSKTVVPHDATKTADPFIVAARSFREAVDDAIARIQAGGGGGGGETKVDLTEVKTAVADAVGQIRTAVEDARKVIVAEVRKTSEESKSRDTKIYEGVGQIRNVVPDVVLSVTGDEESAAYIKDRLSMSLDDLIAEGLTPFE